MLLLKINRQSREPIYRQVTQQIAQLVESEALKPGTILPPTRVLAQTLRVSRFTVAQAYQALWAQGYTKARPGSYTQIRMRPKLATRAQANESLPMPALPLSRAAARLSARQASAIVPAKGLKEHIDFASMQVDSRLFPVEDLRRNFARFLRQHNASLFNYSDPAGYYPLREFIASRMQRHGVALSADEVLITHGSLQGLTLALQLLVNRGEFVAIEQPTFPGALAAVTVQGARVLGVPMLPDGMDLDELSKLLTRRSTRNRPKLLYTIPTFHNPTGATTSQPHREQLLEICQRHTLPLLEDGFQEEFTYFDKVVHPIKSMDNRGLVLYLGTFSKVFVPGLRLGWIAAHRKCIANLIPLKYANDIACSSIVQGALHRYCASGAYELHLRRMNRVFGSRLRRALDALRNELPRGRTVVHEPRGGYLIWLSLEGLRVTERQLLETLLRYGVSAAPGSVFYLGRAPGLALRLSISSLNGEEIEEGARRLGKALRTF